MYIKNNSGPRADPRGTPHVTFFICLVVIILANMLLSIY